MKISEIELQTVKDYCGVSDDDSNGLLTVMLNAAKKFVYGFTGLAAEAADELDDLTAAVLVLVNDMFTTRTMTVEQGQINPFALQLLNLHSVNLL